MQNFIPQEDISKQIDKILLIASERNQILELLKNALIDNDDNQIKKLAARICGLH